MDVPNLILKRCPTPNKGRHPFSRNQKIEMIKSDTSGSLIFFFGYPFFYYDFWKLVKKSLLVDLLTVVAIKKKNNDIYLKITQPAV